MIQINIPPAALPPSNSARPNQDPSEESGFEDILQARVAAEPSVATPVSSSKGADAGTQPSSREDSDDSDLAEEESLSGAAVAAPSVETPEPALEREGLSAGSEALIPFQADADRGEKVSAIVPEVGDGDVDGRSRIPFRSEGPTIDGSGRSADANAVNRPALAAPKAIFPHTLPLKIDAPPTEQASPAFEIPEELETASPATRDALSPSAHQTKPTTAASDAGSEGQSRVETPSGGESKGGGFHESPSDSSRDPSSPREKSAPRPVVGVESASVARPANPAVAQPSNAPVSHSQLDANAPSPAEGGTTPSPQVRAEALIEQVRVHAKPGHSRIAFRLDPPRLGRLSIRLVMRGGRLLGQVRTQTQEAAHLLRSGIEGLRSTMREAGIHVDRLEFQSAPATSPHTAQEGLRDGSGRGTDWGEAPGDSQHRHRGPRGEIRIERAVLEVRNESDDGRLDVVA